MFPRLHPVGAKQGRLDGLDDRTHHAIVFLRTGAHEHIFPTITKYLDISDLYNLAATCKELRYHALTDISYQLSVREALRRKQWTMPVPAEIPAKCPDGYPAPTAIGDWLLYGTHINKTNSMRNRRRIFDLIGQMERQYTSKAKSEGYLNGPHAAQMQKYLRSSIEQQLLIHKLNTMYDYDLFIKCMRIFNQAYKEDLKKRLFTGTKMPIAVENVKQEMKGRKPLPMRNPGRAAKDINSVVKERMKLFMIEKTKFAQKRVFVPVQRGRSLSPKSEASLD